MRNETLLTVCGALTADPDLKFTGTGTPVVRFTVAFNPRTFNRGTGQWEDGDPSFFPCQAWKHLAEHVAESLTKGSRVVVTGRWGEKRWNDPKTNEPRSMWLLEADDVGASLQFANVTISKAARSRPETPPDDPWANGTSAPPAGREVTSTP